MDSGERRGSWREMKYCPRSSAAGPLGKARIGPHSWLYPQDNSRTGVRPSDDVDQGIFLKPSLKRTCAGAQVRETDLKAQDRSRLHHGDFIAAIVLVLLAIAARTRVIASGFLHCQQHSSKRYSTLLPSFRPAFLRLPAEHEAEERHWAAQQQAEREERALP
jgi:hypothetical protein